MRPQQHFGSKKPSRASKDVAALQYVLNARQPTADALVRLFGVKPAQAELMIAQEQEKRSRML